MLEVGFVLVLGLFPFILSLLSMRRLETEAQAHLQQAIATSRQRHLQRVLRDRDLTLTRAFVPLGDPTCGNSAHSAYLRCAINPLGPCEGCLHYESKHASFSAIATHDLRRFNGAHCDTP